MTTAVQKAPRISLDDAVEFAAELYGLRVSASALPSERDQNFRLRTDSGRQFVLKIANAGKTTIFLICKISSSDSFRLKIELEFPRIANQAALTSPRLPLPIRKHFVRLLTWRRCLFRRNQAA
jgi:hypothetical protein